MNDNRDFNNMMCLDVYLASANEEERKAYDKQSIQQKQKAHPLSTWDVAGHSYWDLVITGRKKQDLVKLNELAAMHGWNIRPENFLAKHYEAIVVTDLEQTIQWASGGFEKMTGYSPDFAIGRSPRFLQGENTSEAARLKIRQKLKLREPFSATVTNYRKNREEYACHVSIFPIKNQEQKISHFLALEYEPKS